MSRITLATIGSLGDLHPKIALALELRRRGHDVVICSTEIYRENMASLGFDFYPLRPEIDINDRKMTRDLLESRKGPETLLREILMPSLRDMYDDLTIAVERADALVTGEIVYAAKSVVEKTGVRWITTSLAPISLFSSYDPNVYPTAEWVEYLRPMPVVFHQALFSVMKLTVSHWFEPYRKFRRELGLDEDHDPVFQGKCSDLLHLVMFSKVLSPPQPDWPVKSLQTGFCFYDGHADLGVMPEALNEFLDSGEPPIVFTLGSAAVMDARDFFVESAKAARLLGRRAVLLYGVFNDPPGGLDDSIVAFDYAPFSKLFPRAACVVHQAGVGTTGQVLRAGVPQLAMPFGHDQPDNATRCRRLGVAETIDRYSYRADTAAVALKPILEDENYRRRAREVAEIVNSEPGTIAACDAIEEAVG